MADSTAINIKRMEELMLNFHLTKYTPSSGRVS